MNALLPLLIGAVLLLNQNYSERKTIFEEMSYQQVLEVKLETDIKQIKANIKTENYQPATITFEDAGGNQQTWEMKIRPRGRFRRRVCTFPPVKVNFDKDDLKARNYKKHDELKLVTHCTEEEGSRENLLREYLAYKLYEVISPVHYRAQLLRIKYIDRENNIRLRRYGILLEDEKELASRLDAELCEDCYALPKDSFALDNLHLHSLFQYMIGNSDWSLTMARNLKLLKDDETGKFYLAPYDFDFSGLVNAGYARPDPTKGVSSVRERVFLGLAESDAELQKAVAHFKAKREELLNTIDSFKLLNRSARKDMMNYIQSFYEQLEKGEIVEGKGR